MSQPSIAEEIETLLSETLLSLPEPKELADLYLTAATLQFRRHFRAAHILLQSGFNTEAWILIRSLTELLIRAKWVKRNKSNAAWIIIGTEMKELNQFKAQKSRSGMKTNTIQIMQQRLHVLKPQLPRRARYWNQKKSGEFAALPSAESMARECGLLKVYRTWFKFGSDHTHSSHRVLEDFMAKEKNGDFKHWILDPPHIDVSTTRDRLNTLAVGFLAYLQKFGWPIQKARLEAIMPASK